MTLSRKKILITGAGGFIGSHLVETLIKEGAQVRAFVKYNSRNTWGWLDNLPPIIKNEIEIFAGDICDPFGVNTAMRHCHMVLHLAALIAIPYSYHSPGTYIDTNVKGTLNVLQAARELEVEKIVHTSTSEVYGSAQFVPITEQHPLVGQSPYSASKIGADQLALSYHRSFELPVAIVRPFNTYGPRQSARAVIPTVISQIANGKQTIKVGAIHPTRDFNYVKDTVAGFLAVAKSEQSIGEIINIGSNYEISIKDMIKLVSELMESHVNIEIESQRLRPTHSEVDRLWADNTKAKQLLQWQPQYGGIQGLKKGLLETIHWFKNHTNLRLYKDHLYNI